MIIRNEARKELTQSQLKEWFNYDATTGGLYWRRSPSRRIKAGVKAGTFKTGNGYGQIRFQNTFYRTHRLVYLWHTGIIPQHIDHINRNIQDNRIENLRACSLSENNQNRDFTKIYKKLVGVTRLNNGRYRCVISKDRKFHYIGTYDTPEEAGRARDKKAKELFGDFASLNFK